MTIMFASPVLRRQDATIGFGSSLLFSEHLRLSSDFPGPRKVVCPSGDFELPLPSCRFLCKAAREKRGRRLLFAGRWGRQPQSTSCRFVLPVLYRQASCKGRRSFSASANRACPVSAAPVGRAVSLTACQPPD